MLQTKYITIDEFNEYFNENLTLALGNQGALSFLKRIEDRMQCFINSNLNKNIEKQYPNFTEEMKQCYKMALLEQAIYIYKSGEISVDSGYDPETGNVVGNLKSKFIASNAIDYLRICGIWNRNIKGNNNLFPWSGLWR